MKSRCRYFNRLYGRLYLQCGRRAATTYTVQVETFGGWVLKPLVWRFWWRIDAGV